MSTLPQSPFLSADPPLSADTAAALSQPRDAAAKPTPEEIGLETAYNYPSGPPQKEDQGAPAPEDWNPEDAGATDCIHEIFHFARRLYDDDHRFVLDEQAFMEAIEPPPLFLQRATG